MSLHHGYGTGIRNGLDLWDFTNPLWKAPEIKANNINHPDELSMYLIKRLWEYLQTIELDEPKAED